MCVSLCIEGTQCIFSLKVPKHNFVLGLHYFCRSKVLSRRRFDCIGRCSFSTVMYTTMHHVKRFGETWVWAGPRCLRMWKNPPPLFCQGAWCSCRRRRTANSTYTMARTLTPSGTGRFAYVPGETFSVGGLSGSPGTS